jgi:hypothetical protein
MRHSSLLPMLPLIALAASIGGPDTGASLLRATGEMRMVRCPAPGPLDLQEFFGHSSRDPTPVMSAAGSNFALLQRLQPPGLGVHQANDH